MKSFDAFLLMALVIGVGVGGCSSGVSPVVEYNNAIQALEKDLILHRQTESAMKSTSDQNTKRQLSENLSGLDRNIERLQNRIKSLGPKL